ncbi:DUF3169 family protein [Alkalibaculum sp. M08DMB]|uniref:DUF3169 family protein n=1 Tax=Alkalibaculum sporogenes TaxID=2655001 RepID=A0A6A7K8W3_9FIRM|nr:DUF3169 family protein [Alkalibaculum sporogenes]MPW25543.1 DUF3169 family protein [Alkalibaculum sporogenes]
MKIKNSYVKIIMWMVLGGIVGAIGGLAGRTIGIGKFKEVFINIFELIANNIIQIQIAVGTLSALVILVNYISAKKLMVKDDNDVDELSDKIELKQTIALTFCSINYILSFILFGIAIDGRNQFIIASVIVFVTVMVFSSFMEISIVNQIKKGDPMKKGDPAELDFQNQWIDSCDEAEKLITYQAAYKTFNIMKYLLLATMIIGMIAKAALNAGNTIIVMGGVLWLVMVLAYSYYGCKLQKNKINL